MHVGEFLTLSTIWISILAYTVGCVIFALARDERRVRLAWTIGCAALLAHFLVAFHFYHGWSHDHAYAETARQTAQVFAINWGGGLYINYAVALLWTADVVWWWVAGLGSYLRRPWSLILIWHGFLIFILFNAMVVFKSGLTRWVGLLICTCLCLSWVLIKSRRS